MELQKEWRERCNLRAEEKRLWAEGDRLEMDKLHAKANKVWAEAAKLWMEASNLWANAVRGKYGNTEMKWDGDDCVLANGDRYRADDVMI